MVKHNNGFLINANNKKELKSVLIKTIQMPELELQLMKEKSLQLIQGKFTWEKIAQDYISFFKEIISSKI